MIKPIIIKDIGIKKIEIEGKMAQLQLAKKIDVVLSKTNPREYRLREMWYLGNVFNEVLFEKSKQIHPQALQFLKEIGVELHEEKDHKSIEYVFGCQIVNLREIKQERTN